MTGYQILWFLVVAAVVLFDLLWITRARWWKTMQPIARRLLVAAKRVYGRCRPSLPLIAELLVILGWTLWVGRGYLDLNPAHWPIGHEFGSAVQSHVVWLNLPKCGFCVFWNGFVRGGAPAFSDLHGSLMYPWVLPLTLWLGVINAVKIMLVMAMFMGGLAQWWLARLMKVHWMARLWAAGMGVAGGHLSARMELGAFGVTLGVAACALVIPAVLQAVQSGRRRDAAGLGLLLGLALMAGQGYAQAGLLIGIFPALAVFLFSAPSTRKRAFFSLAIGIAIAFHVAGAFLIPFIRFLPELTKLTDPGYELAQSLSDIPFNLVNNDPLLLNSSPRFPAPYPYLYMIYIGWVAVALTVPGAVVLFIRQRRAAIFFTLGICLVFLIASGLLFRPFSEFSFAVAAIRHVGQISAMAVPLILTFSTAGLDWLLKIPHKLLVRADSRPAANRAAIIATFFIGLAVTASSWLPSEAFSQNWYKTITVDLQTIRQILAVLKTPTTQVVDTPFGEHYWIMPALEQDLKLRLGIRAWDWRDRNFPDPQIIVRRIDHERLGESLLIDPLLEQVSYPENQYAMLWSGSEKLKACEARAIGGNIDVRCESSSPGTLIVQENRWDGWQVRVNGSRQALAPGTDWLAVDLPTGKNLVQFRYRPWDVFAGIGLSLFGWGWAALWLVKKEVRAEIELPEWFSAISET